MVNGTKIRISKLEAARRQLETAIGLWLQSRDALSIHSLAAASLQVLHDLVKRTGYSSALTELPGVRDDCKKQLRTLLAHPRNFLKHADNDPNDILEFNPQVSEMFMLDAVVTYEKLTKQTTGLLATFKAWMMIHNPELIEEAAREKLIEELRQLPVDATLSKIDFFLEYQEVLKKLKLISENA